MFKGFFSILRRFVPPYKKHLVLNVLFNILAAFLTLFSFALIIPILEMLFGINQAHYEFMPLGAGSVKDVVVNDFYYTVQCIIERYGNSTALAVIAGALVVMTALKTGSAYLAAYNMIAIRTGVVRDIRNQIYNRIVGLPIGFFSNERKGDVMARMSGDVTEVENSIMSSLDMMFKNPIMIIVCLTMMVIVSWQLTLFVLVLLPIAGLIMGTVGKRLKRVSLDVQNQWGTLLSNIEETIGGLRIIKAFNAEDKVKRRFSQENEKYRNITRRMQRRYELAHPMSEFLGTATIAIVLWFGGTLILSGKASITAPSFIYYMVIFYNIINPAKEFSRASYSVQKGLASMQRIDKILMAENHLKDPENPTPLTGIKQGITYQNVRFGYGEKMVINDVTLTIPQGKTVALVGQSGSGKTTLADLLPRFYDVDEGSISIDGIDIRQVTKHDLRALMGNVNQEAILFNDSFYNNITFGVENATHEEVVEAAKIANAYDFIMASEQQFDTNIGDRGGNLSGGQRQRISIARAILKNPPILILDEATSALDTESEHLVQQALDNLMRNRTTLVIAHRLSTIKNADLICVVQDGRIVEQGTHDELIAQGGAYKHLVDMQKF
ncbi:MAG: ABC transporter ATP-binding protein [Muribaculaceae bacterium]|nr:ABC transporter ATP-binding protein [Muribaculaceae bacterium]MBQ4008408.1 ABC transporter ATP-binding protein [Muribaculaceae bacterium]